MARLACAALLLLATAASAAQLRTLQQRGVISDASGKAQSTGGATSLQAGPLGGGPLGGGPVTCVTRGQTLKRGSCSSFFQTFKQNADQYVTLNDDDFLKIVNSNPQPTTQCCADARSFITNSCTCDPTIVQYNQQQGLSDNQLKAVVRAAQLSQCSWAANGGWINDPCRTTSRVVIPMADNSGNSQLVNIQLDGR